MGGTVCVERSKLCKISMNASKGTGVKRPRTRCKPSCPIVTVLSPQRHETNGRAIPDGLALRRECSAEAVQRTMDRGNTRPTHRSKSNAKLWNAA
jgi:hypothetical protein